MVIAFITASLYRHPYPGFLWMSALPFSGEILSVGEIGWLNDWLG